MSKWSKLAIQSKPNVFIGRLGLVFPPTKHWQNVTNVCQGLTDTRSETGLTLP